MLRAMPEKTNGTVSNAPMNPITQMTVMEVGREMLVDVVSMGGGCISINALSPDWIIFGNLRAGTTRFPAPLLLKYEPKLLEVKQD